MYLKADARAKFGWVVEVVDNVRAAGVDQLGLLTDQRRQTGSSRQPDRAATPAGNRGDLLWEWQSAPAGAKMRT